MWNFDLKKLKHYTFSLEFQLPKSKQKNQIEVNIKYFILTLEGIEIFLINCTKFLLQQEKQFRKVMI